MKLTKKITSAIAALAMAATMGMSALSASAACVHFNNTCLGELTIVTYWDSDGNGTPEWAAPPHDLDGLFTDTIINSTNGVITVNFGSTTIYDITATVNGIYDTYAEAIAADPDDNYVNNNAATVALNTQYYLTLNYNGHPGGNPMPVMFVTTTCSNDCGCGCND